MNKLKALYQSNSSTLFIGKNVIHLPICQSTNDEAVKLTGQNKLSEGGVVITDSQTAGKGQRGNVWDSQPNANLTFSLLLKPNFLSVTQQFDLNVIISLAILDLLKTYSSGFQVKWPNDIYYYDKKICGILIQNFVKGNKIETSIVGIGLNVNQKNFAIETATSLSVVSQNDQNLSTVFEKLNLFIEAKYLALRAGKNKLLRDEYLNQMYWFGEDHLFESEVTFMGRIIGISPEGRLEIETQKGLQSFAMKEVKFIQ